MKKLILLPLILLLFSTTNMIAQRDMFLNVGMKFGWRLGAGEVDFMYGPEISLTAYDDITFIYGGVVNIDIMNKDIKVSACLETSFLLAGAKLGGAALIRKEDLDVKFGLQTGLYMGYMLFTYWDAALIKDNSVMDIGVITKVPICVKGSFPSFN